MYRDILFTFVEISKGLEKYSKQYGAGLPGIGIDTWGMDFGLIDGGGGL